MLQRADLNRGTKINFGSGEFGSTHDRAIDAAGRRRARARRRRLLRIATTFTLLALWLAPVAADGIDDVGDVLPHIEIVKSERVLRIKFNDEVYRQFPIAVGRGGPGDKQLTGDKRTPVGIYRVVGFNDSSRFHLFMRLNYPNVKDAFYGLKNKTITRSEFDRIIDSLRLGKLPPQNTALGGAIGIHGIGEENEKTLRIHSKMDWTEGCIALTNAEIAELRAYVDVGTEVVIKE